MSEDAKVDSALDQLRDAIRQRVRAEQLVNRLTRLGNDEALGEWLKERVDTGEPFWIALVEVDRFKNVNQEFGHSDADLLLVKIGERLLAAARDYFGDGAVPFHPHGDEFFLAGKVAPGPHTELVASGLDQLRAEISRVRIFFRPPRRAMQCTVSIGWLQSSDALEGKDGLTPMSVRGYLELAVSEAKWGGRDRTIRFTPALREPSYSEGRADCAGCRASFSLLVPRGAERPGHLRCPNCGSDAARPASLTLVE
jgi:diguanylate cyclase (GGDEF)-like protein